MLDFVLSSDLIDDEFGVTMGFKMLDIDIFSKLHSYQQSIVSRHIVRARLS